MKKSIVSLFVVIALMVGSVSAWAASKNAQIFWTGYQYEDGDWTGVNVTTFDGKKFATKRLYKEQAFYATVSGDWVYFLKFNQDEEIIIGNLYRMKKDGTKLTQLTKSNKVGRFFIEGNSIYYDAYDDKYEHHNLYVMSLDGKGAKISAKDFNDWNYTISQGIVYYVNQAQEGKLYTMKVNGTGKKALSTGGVSDYAVFGNTIFYSEYGEKGTKAYMLDTTGKNKVTVSTAAQQIRPLAALNQWIYFEQISVDAKSGEAIRTLEKIKRDGKQQTKVAALTNESLLGHADSGFIYKSGDGKLYHVALDGKVTK